MAKQDVTYQALQRGLSDALDTRNLKYFLFSLCIAGIVVMGFLVMLSGFIQDAIGHLDLGMGWLASISFFVANVLLMTLGYFLIVPLMFLGMSVFTHRVALNIKDKRYPHMNFENNIGAFESFIETAVVLLKGLTYFLIASPALLLFGAGQIIYVVIGFVLFRKLLLLDTLGTHLPLALVREKSRILNGGQHFSSTIVLYIASLLPVLNLFVPYLSICILLNESMSQEEGPSRYK